DGVKIVRERRVVLALKQIGARRLASRDAGRCVEASVARADFRIEKGPADRIHRDVAVVVKVGGADLIVGVEVPAVRVPRELRERVDLPFGAVISITGTRMLALELIEMHSIVRVRRAVGPHRTEEQTVEAV